MADTAAARQLMTALEHTFESIYHERMVDIPILNDELTVKAIDFRLHEGLWLGILITPWFMNLMLLPGADEDWSRQRELSEHQHLFPSGQYTFIAGFEAALGPYRSCSLFSPMFEFADQSAAEETARTVLKELMNSDNQDAGDIQQQHIEAIWRVEEATTSTEPEPAAGESDKSRPITTKLSQPLSRRELLRGSFLKDNPKA